MTMLDLLVDQIVSSTGSVKPSARPLFALVTQQEGAIGPAADIGLASERRWMVQCSTDDVGSHLVGVASPIGGEHRTWVTYTELRDTHIPKSKSTAAGNRVRELKFQESNPEAFRSFVGQWVVLEGESIIAHGADPVRLVADARSRGIRVPYVVYIEELKDDSVWIGL